MLGFRLREGLDLEVVASRYGRTAVRRVEEGVAEGLQRGWVIRELKPSGCGGGGKNDMDVGDVRGESEEEQDSRRKPQRAVLGGRSEGLGTLRLSDPDGFLFSNSVISSVFCELDGWKRGKEEQRGGAGAAR